MGIRGNRKAIIAIITASSVVAVAVIATVVFFTMRSQQRQDDVAEARRVAATFNKSVSTYRSDVSKALSGAGPTDAAAMRVALVAAVAAAPTLGDAPTWGKDHSTTYQEAVKAQKTLTEPYAEPAKVLDEAVVGQKFVKAARAALGVRTRDFVKSGTLPNGDPIRKKLVPGFEKALKKFKAVEVPSGQAKLAKDVRTALQAIIKQGKQVARNLDSGRGGSINAQTEYAAANLALFSYESSLRSDISKAVSDAAAEVSDQEPDAA